MALEEANKSAIGHEEADGAAGDPLYGQLIAFTRPAGPGWSTYLPD
jgi:hypothetical protein